MRLAVVAVLALAAAGCGGASHPVAAPSPAPVVTSPSPSATASPTPSTLSTTQAAAAYLRIVKHPNADLSRLDAEVAGHANSLTTYHKWGRILRDDFHSQAVALRTTLWAANVAVVAHKMADADATLVADTQDVIAATTNDDAVAALLQFNTDSAVGGRLAEQMRELLGLPPASA